MIDLSAPGVRHPWRIGVGTVASEHTALRFTATRLGAIREFNRICRTQPRELGGLPVLVDLCLVVDDKPCRPLRSLDDQGRVRGDFHGWRPLRGAR